MVDIFNNNNAKKIKQSDVQKSNEQKINRYRYFNGKKKGRYVLVGTVLLHIIRRILSSI